MNRTLSFIANLSNYSFFFSPQFLVHASKIPEDQRQIGPPVRIFFVHPSGQNVEERNKDELPIQQDTHLQLIQRRIVRDMYDWLVAVQRHMHYKHILKNKKLQRLEKKEQKDEKNPLTIGQNDEKTLHRTIHNSEPKGTDDTKKITENSENNTQELINNNEVNSNKTIDDAGDDSTSSSISDSSDSSSFSSVSLSRVTQYLLSNIRRKRYPQEWMESLYFFL